MRCPRRLLSDDAPPERLLEGRDREEHCDRAPRRDVSEAERRNVDADRSNGSEEGREARGGSPEAPEEAGEEEDREEEDDAQATEAMMATQDYPAGRLPKLVTGKLEGRNGVPSGMGLTQKGNGKPTPKLPVKNLSKPRRK